MTELREGQDVVVTITLRGRVGEVHKGDVYVDVYGEYPMSEYFDLSCTPLPAEWVRPADGAE